MKFLPVIASFALLSSASAGLAADAVAGAIVFKKCAACHSVDAGVNKVGPSLHGVLGRAVATEAGYSYSAGMKEFGAGKVWDEALLTEYLPKPAALVKGTKMAFAGLKKPEDIANIIEYLKTLK